MNLRELLARNLVAESEAYGYTLTIWAGGEIAIHLYGSPSLTQIFLYVIGALIGFAGLALLAFPHLFTDRDPDRRQHLIAASMIHVLGTLGSLVVNYALVSAAEGYSVPGTTAFVLAGLQLTLTYNLLILGERVLVRKVVHPASTIVKE
ncbi:MAG TPA: hypothetical protein VFJ06_08410 [Halococcus sp.]|nr:hypothetical protein [Halococcus sp.]